MSISPILTGRLPNSLVADRFQSSLQSTQRSLTYLQDTISSGQRFFLPGEQPTAAITTIMLQKQLERQQHYQENINTDRSLLSASEAALTTISDALNQAKGLALAGIGATLSDGEKEALAMEAASLLKSALNAANTKFRGRHLFGGSETQDAPFESVANNEVRYNGDELGVGSYIAPGSLVFNNVDGQTAFGAKTAPLGADIDPALTLDTRIADLHGGTGLVLGSVEVTLDNGSPDTKSIDLSQAETIGDIKTILEAAFAASPVTLTVDVDPTTQHGIRLTPSAGTVAVTDLQGANVAADLGIAAGASAQISGGDIDPQLTMQTKIADLNAGTGIGVTAGKGLLITNGNRSATIDLSSVTTIEDLRNLLEEANLELTVGINETANGLAVSSRLSGAALTIGENGGTNATQLGIRSMTAQTLLADLNLGRGVPVDAGSNLNITRRDGSTVSIDLSNAVQVQDVLDAVNAVDPGSLVASLTSVGNGISLLDNSGTGPLAVESNDIGLMLGLAGDEPGSDPAVPLNGSDVNPVKSTGVFGVLSSLESALHNADDIELGQLSNLIDAEIERFSLVRGEVGARLQTIDAAEQRIDSETLQASDTLSTEFDTDLTDALTELVMRQQSLEATLNMAAQSLRLSLLSYL